MKTKKIKVYSFNELDEKAKQRVLRDFQTVNVDYDEWDDLILEDWTGRIMLKGYYEVEILYSGFGSQGDGACFTAKVDLGDWLKAHRLTRKFKALYKDVENYLYPIKIIHNSHYYYSTSTEVENPDLLDLSRRGYQQLDKVLILIEEEREKIGNKIYKELEEAYSHLTEEKEVIETIEANEYEFLASGKLYSEF